MLRDVSHETYSAHRWTLHRSGAAQIMSPRHFVDVRRTLGGPVTDRDRARSGTRLALLSTLTAPG